jgi:putative transcriptional regulator
MKKEISDLAKGIMAGLESAFAHANGKPTSGTVEHVVFVPDVKTIREGLAMSQRDFSIAYDIPLATLKGWEQHRRRLDKTALAYLRTISLFPEETKQAQNSNRQKTTPIGMKHQEAGIAETS